MISLIEEHRAQIDELCRRFHVKRLELFGSAASGEFVAGKSDLDFFVEYLKDEWSPVKDWFGLQEHLEDLFHCKVDLVSVETAKNPYFLSMANEHRVSLYAA
jgi:predicted nucleotidyltransferase